MKFYNIEQNSEEWYKLRLGKITASKVSKLFMGKATAGYNEVISDAAYEILTGENPESFSNGWMERGTELEPIAREWYELENFVKIKPGGFYCDEKHGASPDGHIGEKGLVEFKCPKHSTHLHYLKTNEVPKDYYAQVQDQLSCSGREWCDFVSFHPKLPPLVIRVYPDEKFLKSLDVELKIAFQKIEEMVSEIKKLQLVA